MNFQAGKKQTIQLLAQDLVQERHQRQVPVRERAVVDPVQDQEKSIRGSKLTQKVAKMASRYGHLQIKR